MKTFIITSLFCLIATLGFSQTDSISTPTTTSIYTSAGLSIGNVTSDATTFSKASFPSVELGITRKNVSLGAVFGLSSLQKPSETLGFYELKTAVCFPIGDFSGYGLFGVGAYFESEFNTFIEYGAGFSFMPNKLGYFVQYSNWAGTNYVSVGASVLIK